MYGDRYAVQAINSGRIDNWYTKYMFIEGLTDWEKRRLALIMKERGFTAFMVIKHASAAISSAKRGYAVNPVDQQYLEILDELIREVYGYKRLPNEMRYSEEEVIYNTENK